MAQNNVELWLLPSKVYFSYLLRACTLCIDCLKALNQCTISAYITLQHKAVEQNKFDVNLQ